MSVARIVTVVSVATMLLAPRISGAHHSAVMFDDQKEITLQGVVKEFQYTNPHSWLLVDVAEHAVAAAFSDPRLPPITAADFAAMELEVSVLTAPEPIAVTDRAGLGAALDALRGGWFRGPQRIRPRLGRPGVAQSDGRCRVKPPRAVRRRRARRRTCRSTSG